MAEPALRAGIAQADITPPLGVEMCGYGPYEKRVCTDVLDPLYARALWLESGGSSVAIVTVDLCMADRAMHQSVAEELRAGCGMDGTRLMICASHTHSGPATQRLFGWGERDEGYVGRLPGLLARAVVAARGAAVPAQIGVCRARIRDVGVNREQPAIAPTDTAAQLMRVDRSDGTPLAVVCNFGAHGVVRYPFTSRISADWPGLVAAYIKEEMQGAAALFLQGACGNINGHDMTFRRDDPETHQKVCDMRAGDVAKRFADQVLPALRSLKTSASASIRSFWKEIDLPCVAPDRAALEKVIRENQSLADSRTLGELRPLYQRLTRETDEERKWRQARFNVDSVRRQIELIAEPPYVVKAPVQVMKIGNAVLVGWPGEIFVELGIELRQRSPYPMTFVSSFANDTVGYIPTAAVYESRGRGNDFGRYPRDFTHLIYGRLPFREDVGRILVEETLTVLQSV